MTQDTTGRLLVWCARGYLALSALTVLAVALLRDDAAAVTPAVWIRTTIVLVSAVVMTLLGARAAHGSRGALRRVRIVSVVVLVAVAVVVALPGAFPVWVRAEQAVCGFLVLGVAVAAFRLREPSHATLVG